MILTTFSVFDKYRLWRETRHRKKFGFPTAKASSEWVKYYDGLYDVSTPDPVVFGQLIKKFGAPDFNNPFPQGSPEYYRLSPGLLVGVDIKRIWAVPALPGDDARDEDNILADVSVYDKIMLAHQYGEVRFKAETELRNLVLGCWLEWLMSGLRPQLGLSKAEYRWMTTEALSMLAHTNFESFNEKYRSIWKEVAKWQWFAKNEEGLLYDLASSGKVGNHAVGSEKVETSPQQQVAAAEQETALSDEVRSKLNWNNAPID